MDDKDGTERVCKSRAWFSDYSAIYRARSSIGHIWASILLVLMMTVTWFTVLPVYAQGRALTTSCTTHSGSELTMGCGATMTEALTFDCLPHAMKVHQNPMLSTAAGIHYFETCRVSTFYWKKHTLGLNRECIGIHVCVIEMNNAYHVQHQPHILISFRQFTMHLNYPLESPNVRNCTWTDDENRVHQFSRETRECVQKATPIPMTGVTFKDSVVIMEEDAECNEQILLAVARSQFLAQGMDHRSSQNR